MTSALVTGSTGFVGSFLVEELLDHGRSVKCVIRRSSDLRWLKDKPVDYVTWDLVGGEPPVEQLEEVEEVYHVAGLLTAHRKEDFFRVNADAVDQLLSGLHEADAPVRRIVQVSSLAAAGPAFDRTPREERDPCEPVSFYGKSKREGEIRLKQKNGKYPYTIVRPPIVMGPRDTMILDMVDMVRKRIVPRFGRYKKYNFIFVKDLVRGMREAADSTEAKYQTYFLTHPEQISWERFMKAIGRELDVDPAIISLPDGVATALATVAEHTDQIPGLKESFTRDKVRELQQPAWLCSSRKAEEDFGFQCRFGFLEAVEETISWYQRYGWIPNGA